MLHILFGEEDIGKPCKVGKDDKMADIAVLQLMNKDVATAGPKETLSKVLGILKKKNVHELPITDDGGRVVGFFSFDLLSKKKHLSLGTKMERLMVSPPKIGADAGVFDAAKILVETGFRALVVVRDGAVLEGIISRTDIIGAVSDIESVEKTSAEEIMTDEPRLLTTSDSAEDALSLMNELEELCAPVVDESGRISGGILIDDVSRALWRKEEGAYVGDVVGENHKPKIQVGSFVSPVAVSKKDYSLKRICEEMSSKNPYLCVVVDDSMRPVGVITQQDILKTLVKPGRKRSVHVDVTGLKIDDSFTHSSLTSKIDRFAKKIEGFNWIEIFSLNLHIITYARGARDKWNLRARLASDKGMFTASSSGWDVLRCADEVFEELGRRIISLKK